MILGKTNLSELANFLTEDMPSGYSSLGGQVLNPYDTSITPSGSSSGSGTAAALGLAPLTSAPRRTARSPARPSRRAWSAEADARPGQPRPGMLPIAASQDTAGPMTRTVADAAALLAVIAGPDPADPATADAAGDGRNGCATLTLDAGGLAGVRLGWSVPPAEDESEADEKPDEHRMACHEQALAALRRGRRRTGRRHRARTRPRRRDDRAALRVRAAASTRYLATLGDGAPVAFNGRDPGLEPGPRRRRVEVRPGAHRQGGRHRPRGRECDAYRQARDRDLRPTTDGCWPRRSATTSSVLVFPGHRGLRVGRPGPAGRASCIPAGYAANNRRPVGIMLVGRPWTDDRLLSLAYAFERAHPVRRPPAAINPAAFRGLGS